MLALLEQRRSAGQERRHCWGGTLAEMHAFLAHGPHISQRHGTFPKATETTSAPNKCLRTAISWKLIALFFASTRRGKRNEPAMVRHVAGAVAELRVRVGAGGTPQQRQCQQTVRAAIPASSWPASISQEG